MSIPTIIGITGAFIVLLAFFLNENNKLSTESLLYDALNVIGSMILMAYSIILMSIPFLILNAIWAIISLRDVFIDLSRNQKNTHPTI